MTKRVNMSQPQWTEQPKRASLWPFIIVGAAAGAVWFGMDTDALNTNAAGFLQFAGSVVQPLFDNLLSLLRTATG